MKRRASGPQAASSSAWRLLRSSPSARRAQDRGGVAEGGRVAFLDGVAGVREGVRGAAHAAGDVLVGPEAAGIGQDGDARELGLGRAVERGGGPARVARMRRGEDLEGEAEVGDAARHRAGDREELAVRQRIGGAR